jgi:hypothetical protein
MKFLADERLYSHTEECLRFLRELRDGFDDSVPRATERYHMYWHGTFSSKQAFAVKSCLATQDLDNLELWLWLDTENGYDGFEDNPFLRPFLSFLHVKRFDPEVEARGTPLERRPDLYRGASPTQRSNFFRFVVLYKYGGIYTDMDVMFLRDFSVLHHNASFRDEFCYRWSAHISYANSAVLRLNQESDTAHALLVRCGEVGSCRPKNVLRFKDNVDLDIVVLPCPFFDPLWPHRDGKDNYKTAPFQRFGDFFRKFGWRFKRNPTVRSYRDFFPGAFAYHWHNFWDAREHKDSYFWLFNREFDIILREKLGIDLPAQRAQEM